MSAQELELIIDLLTARPAPENQTAEQMRARFAKLATFLPTPDDVICRPVDAGGVPGEWIAAPGASDEAQILYLHGGGYVIGSIATHRTLCYDLAKAAGCRALSADYRLAPEHAFPAAVDDALAAYRWITADGAKAAQTAIAGDSAGGGLTIATLLAIKQADLAMPACAVPISPWIDLQAIGDSMTTKAEIDPMVQRDRLLEMAGWYLGAADARTPQAAPLYGDLSGLPPLLIQVGTRETLLDDSTRIADRAKAAGVEVTLEVWDGMIHVWPLFAPMLSEGRAAIDQAAAFIRKHTG